VDTLPARIAIRTQSQTALEHRLNQAHFENRNSVHVVVHVRVRVRVRDLFFSSPRNLPRARVDTSNMDHLDHENLDAYQRSLDFLALVFRLPRGEREIRDGPRYRSR